MDCDTVLRVKRFSIIRYKTGRTNKVRSVAETSPPITTVASGLCTSAPELVESAMGKNPRDATRAVISTGRKRVSVPWKITCFKSFIPSLRKELNSAIRTIPFKTATPKRAMKPIPADMLNGIPRRYNAKIPPIADNGIAVKIRKLCLNERKVK